MSTRQKPRRARRRDANESEIVQALAQAGAFVLQMDDFDLLVAFRGDWYVLEVKTRTGKLNQNQCDLLAAIDDRATVHVVRSAEQALEAIGATGQWWLPRPAFVMPTCETWVGV